MSLLDTASLILTPNGYKADKLYSVKPTDASGDMTVVRATTATRVNSAGFIESVAINVPRLDYTNASCPSILVEPARTNLITYSEDFSNAIWSKLGTITVTANQTTAPDGNNTADLILGADSTSSISQIYNGSIGVVYTSSFFIKNNNSTQSQLLIRNTTTVVGATLNWTGFVLSSITNTTGTSTFQSYNNGWYRITSTYTSLEAVQRPRIYPTLSTNQSVYLWGAQIEAGSNATSYIPTTTIALARNADVISKTGISSLIGQTQGTLYAEINITTFNSGVFFTISDGTSANRIQMYKFTDNKIYCDRTSATQSGATSLGGTGSALSVGTYKVAFAYQSGNSYLYINGAQVGATSAATFTFGSMGKVNIGSNSADASTFNDRIELATLFQTRLTNAQLATLTTL